MLKTFDLIFKRSRFCGFYQFMGIKHYDSNIPVNSVILRLPVKFNGKHKHKGQYYVTFTDIVNSCNVVTGDRFNRLLLIGNYRKYLVKG
ncbi:hypothetical protein [Lactobacillus sp. ESL0677]|uniref:hypothetical protein n=1 Tax=Lactobacillus sp. ESL0677 TaxID=2983208 RepID=UPI0023F9F90C|nr:hypothetical protein [Lactobacillus sp. ESL0677]WEV36229.1 hypothetical protein OZX76_05640 [Lactobacillus sp. ESL0677]